MNGKREKSYFFIFSTMKKFIAIALLTLSLPMAAMAHHKTAGLNAKAAAIGAPSYQVWAAKGGTFWAGYEGYIDMLTNYLTAENQTKAVEKKVVDPVGMKNVLNGTKQSVQDWLRVNPWK